MPFLTINNAMFPFLVFGDADGPMPWDHGSIYSLRLKSTFLRFTPRGMQYSSSPAPPLIVPRLWKSAVCLPTSDGLCALPAAAGSMVWFPTQAVDLPDDFSRIPANAYLADFANGSACSSAATGRDVKMFDERYEVSLCDLLDANLDVVFDRETIYWRRDVTGAWMFFLISVLCVYLTSCVSENIVATVHNRAETSGRVQGAAVCGTLALIWYVLFVEDTRALLLTHEDRTLTVHLLVYACVQTAAQFVSAADDVHGARISQLTACIGLLTLRVHYSFDNPYMLVLSLLFGVRSFFKFLAVCVRPPVLAVHALMLFDFFTFCSMLDNGLMANSAGAFSGTATQVVLVLVCVLVAVLTLAYKWSKCPAAGV